MLGPGRQAARVVLLDSESRVLLLQASDPTRPARGAWWELPGGGIERGEASAAAAARELREETGISAVEVGPCVWRQRARYTFAGYLFDQQEHIHVAWLAGEPPDDASGDGYRPGGLEAIEVLAFSGYRWWSVDELRAHISDGGRVIPPWLGEQLSVILEAGLPVEPLDLGDIGDAL